MHPDLLGRARRQFASIRTRLLLAMLVVLAVGLGGTAFGTSQVLEARVDARIQDQLSQEAEELRLFAAQGLDPETGDPFGDDGRRLLEVFVTRSVATEGEVLVAYVDGVPVASTPQFVPYDVAADDRLTARFATVSDSARGSASTAAGPFEYLAVPVTAGGEPTGVLLVGVFRDVVATEVDQTVRVTLLVALVALLVGFGVAIGLARRILRPLERMTDAADELRDDDLSRRLDVVGHDEVARLSATFNAMLDRIETAFDAQRRFVDDAGHELRTPITIVRGHLELLASDADPAERAATTALVLDELDRMRRIVEDLLTLARVERPDFVQPAPLELDELTTAALRKASSLSDAHRWRLDQVAVGEALGDEQRLTQALIALAHNATRHTPAGTTVTIGSAVVGDDVQLWVQDDGPGVAPEDRARIFDRFARGTQGRRMSDGAGLGLAIVRAIAEGHGGRVDLSTPSGGGARFDLHLPGAAAVPNSSHRDTTGAPTDPADAPATT